MWNGTKHRIGDEAFVTVTNRGSGPTAVTKLLFFGEVPYPSGENGTEYANDPDVSGIYDPEADSEATHVVVPPGQQKTIYSYRSPFGFVPGVGTNCQNSSQAGMFTLTLENSVADRRVSKEYGIHYTASKKFNNCTITIRQKTDG
ncbi:hypothetical protein [Halarchaeum salinum]|uniref:DUF11 domain-containing protein n=1 Tax=Halarchaeum salinum TaxID=489912 RepID=A0AAV3S363_9EURY